MKQLTDLKELFEAVQMNSVLEDGKIFTDCIAKVDLDEINSRYQQQKNITGFVLKKFVLDNFELPVTPQSDFITDTTKRVEEHINKLWEELTRKPDTVASSLIPLPHPYIVPGEIGRAHV